MKGSLLKKGGLKVKLEKRDFKANGKGLTFSRLNFKYSQLITKIYGTKPVQNLSYQPFTYFECTRFSNSCTNISISTFNI
jgi:hypothetical protein